MAESMLPVVSELQPQWKTAGFLDLETTGLDAKRDQVVELSLALFAYDPATYEIKGIIDVYTGQREPSCPVSREASAKHGLTKRKLRGLRLDDGRVGEMLDRAEFVVAHNAEFDSAFLAALYPATIDKEWLCSMRGLPWKEWGHQSRALQELARANGIAPETAHRAEADVFTGLALLAAAAPTGRTILAELVETAKQSSADVDPIVRAFRRAGLGASKERAAEFRALRPDLPVETLAAFADWVVDGMKAEGSRIKSVGFFFWALENRFDEWRGTAVPRTAPPARGAEKRSPSARPHWALRFGVATAKFLGKLLLVLLCGVVLIVGAALKGQGRRRR